MESYLSKRSAASLERQSLPWRFAPSQTYDAEKNPDGLISFGTAENVTIPHQIELLSRRENTKMLYRN